MGRERAGPSNGLGEYEDTQGEGLHDMENQEGCSKDNDMLSSDLSIGSDVSDLCCIFFATYFLFKIFPLNHFLFSV